MSLTLALSTSQSTASVALLKDGVVLNEFFTEKGVSYSEGLLMVVDKLMYASNTNISDIDFFAVDVGPGSFTGVRIGVTVINAFAHVFSKPAIEVSSLYGLRFIRKDYPILCSIIDARNGNAYAALYRHGSALIEPSAVVVEDFLRRMPKGTLFVGDGAKIYRERIFDLVHEPRFMREHINVLKASFIGLAAFEKQKCEEFTIMAVPMYLRSSQAERMKNV
ncbi:MAG: tRNA (adenosine(37)-N6)-threonylcarbamoyltransferase complex dimerization subunit type 1 TsaB [Clostridia bacterium]